jgi:hypothetical protein
MKAFACIPSYATGIIVAHMVPYARSHDTRLGRESTWPEVLSGSHFFRLLMVSGQLMAADMPLAPGQRAATGAVRTPLQHTGRSHPLPSGIVPEEP